jgi:hypothetical protein
MEQAYARAAQKEAEPGEQPHSRGVTCAAWPMACAGRFMRRSAGLRGFQEMWMRQVPLLLVCTALAGCAATGAERFSPGLTVAPVSLMGDHLAVRDVGASALQDYRREEATASTSAPCASRCRRSWP